MFMTMSVTHSTFQIAQFVSLRRSVSNMFSAYNPSSTSTLIVRYSREKLKRSAVPSITVNLSFHSVVLTFPTYITGSQTFREISSPVNSLLLSAQIFSGGLCYSTQEPSHVHSILVLPPKIMISGWTLPQALVSDYVGIISGMPGRLKRLA